MRNVNHSHSWQLWLMGGNFKCQIFPVAPFDGEMEVINCWLVVKEGGRRGGGESLNASISKGKRISSHGLILIQRNFATQRNLVVVEVGEV